MLIIELLINLYLKFRICKQNPLEIIITLTTILDRVYRRYSLEL